MTDTSFHDIHLPGLDIKHFLKRAISIEDIKAAMCWLPLWEDCRSILKDLAIPWNIVENRLNEISAFEKDRERLVLYELILEGIQKYPPKV